MGVSASLVHYPEHRRIGNDIMIFFNLPIIVPTPDFLDKISFVLYQITGVSFGPGLLLIAGVSIPAVIYVLRD